jgi:hypothetical protein
VIEVRVTPEAVEPPGRLLAAVDSLAKRSREAWLGPFEPPGVLIRRR